VQQTAYDVGFLGHTEHVNLKVTFHNATSEALVNLATATSTHDRGAVSQLTTTNVPLISQVTTLISEISNLRTTSANNAPSNSGSNNRICNSTTKFASPTRIIAGHMVGLSILHTPPRAAASAVKDAKLKPRGRTIWEALPKAKSSPSKRCMNDVKGKKLTT
jgi:hypothetical protein